VINVTKSDGFMNFSIFRWVIASGQFTQSRYLVLVLFL